MAFVLALAALSCGMAWAGLQRINRILHYGRIDCRKCDGRQYHSRGRPPRLPALRERTMLPVTQLASRVLAHELYHTLANTTKHGSRAVGKSKYTVQDLLSPRFLFESA